MEEIECAKGDGKIEEVWGWNKVEDRIFYNSIDNSQLLAIIKNNFFFLTFCSFFFVLFLFHHHPFCYHFSISFIKFHSIQIILTLFIVVYLFQAIIFEKCASMVNFCLVFKQQNEQDMVV